MAVEGGGIGARLRSGREKLGLTVLQVSERLHTDTKIVDALEADDLAALGAPVYARGHIRHYAELVDESATELLAIYANLNTVAQPDLTQIAKVPQSDNSSKLVAPALLVIAVFAIAGAIWWISALSKKDAPLSETHVVGSSDTQTPGEAGGDQDAAAGRGAAATAQDVTAGPSPGSHADATTAKANASQRVSANANASPKPGQTPAANANANPRAGQPPAANARSAAAAQPSSGAKGAASAPTAAAPPAPAPTAVAANAGAAHSKHDTTVTLRYSADSWTEVYDASGQRLFYDVGAANTVQNFTGTYPLRVVLGNASGVSVEFNGHSAPIADLLHPDGSAQFSINRSGRVVRARSAADGG